MTAEDYYSGKITCSMGDRHRPFGETCCFHIPDR